MSLSQQLPHAMSNLAIAREQVQQSYQPLVPEPEFIQYRIQIYDRIMKKYKDFVSSQPKNPIKISIADGRQLEGQAWQTTPIDIAKMLSLSLEDIVISKVNGQLFDLYRPLEKDSAIEFLDFENDEGRAVFWHSSAHVLGEACEKHYGCLICFGPPTEDGFHYDVRCPNDRSIVPEDYPHIQHVASKIIKEKQPFERLEMTKEELLEMFKYNPYKVHFINEKIPDGTTSTVYRCGPLIDLCLGPHIPHTGRIKAFQVTKSSSSYFLGDSNNDVLQRIYGISFPDQKQMKEYIKFKEEAEKRDHRKLGKEHQLYFFHELSPGSCFFLPHGARIYNSLIEFIREEYRKRGFSEVISPNMFNVNLWKTSGHWVNYKENMFCFEVEKEQFALKPMNCPGHCLMFDHRERSYRELPIRFADFGVLHRNELSGALTGLTRVRRFCQDDAHIFCRNDQISSEIKGALDFLDSVYKVFGFKYSLKLSTRPEKYLGEISVWDQAEKQLEQALNESGKAWELNPGDGAFYGPKIDITLMDAQKRKHQCATIQLDFQLPIRFNLKYRTSFNDGQSDDTGSDFERPVIIHRAVLGSVERMIAILTENYAGKWPFWLSPRQVCVVPVSHASDEYAEKVKSELHNSGFYVEADIGDSTFNKKIRNAELAQHAFIFVVGNHEETSGTVNVRKASSDGKDVILTLDKAISQLQELKRSRSIEAFLHQ